MREGDRVPGVAMDTEPVRTAAMGVVQPLQRCFILHRAEGAAVTTVTLPSPEDVLQYLQDHKLEEAAGCLWVDVQGGTEGQGRRVLQQLFPGMQPSQVEAVLAPEAYDVVELQPVRGQYLVGSLACARGRGRVGSTFTPTELENREEDAVICAFACSERCIVTLHSAPFVGLAELLRHVEVEGGQKKRASKISFSNDVSVETSGASASLLHIMTSSIILCTLICFTCEAFLPDPTSLLSEVGNIDEMVLLISPGQQDQNDLLRRVALLRRRISNFRTGLYLKEKLLQELIAPIMRSSFVAKESNSVITYKETLEKVRQVSERLDDTRDMLNQANLNFVTGVSMRMSQASAGLDFKMALLNQVAAVCLPINLVISIFGMNCKVPYINDQNDTLVPFWCICGGLIAWAIICLTPLFREAIRGLKTSSIAPCE